VTTDLQVHLGDEGAGRVEDPQPSPLRLAVDRPRHPVRAEYDGGTVRDLGQFLDKHRAPCTQTLNDMAVVHNLVPDIDGSTEHLQGPLHDLDGTVDPGTKAPGVGKHDLHRDETPVPRQMPRSSNYTPPGKTPALART
jgi:hypothetical protein